MEGSIQSDQVVDQYKLENLTDQDQLRVHYSAYEIDTGKAVSMSILKQEYVGDDLFVQDYLHRIQSLTQIRHPNLTKYLQAGLFDGTLPYVTMEPVSGFTLGERVDRLAQGQAPAHPIYALTLVQQMASGLALLERLELYHYELTPKHIQLRSVTLKGEESVVVSDLDIPDQYAGEFVQYSDYAAGYLSPEQLSGKEIDGRSHVYTLGIILHELLCGQRSKKPRTRWNKMWSALSGGSTLEQLRPNLSTETYSVVERSLYKNRRHRFSSLLEFHAALVNALAVEEVPVPVRAVEPTRRPQPFFLIPIVMLLVFVVLGLLGLWLLPGLRNEPTSSAVVAAEDSVSVISITETALFTPSPAPSNTTTPIPSRIPTEQVIRRTRSAEEDISAALPGPILETSSPAPTETSTLEPTPTSTATVPPSKTPTAIPTPKPAFRVLTSSANLRLGPGTVYDPIGFIFQDDEFEIIGRSSGSYIWLNIQMENGLRGWVASDVGELVDADALTTIQAAATIPPPPTPTFTPTPTETPIPATLAPPAASGSGGGGGGGSGGDDKPRSTPTPPL